MSRSALPNPLRVLFVEDNEDGTVGGSHVCLLNMFLHLDRRIIEPVALFYQENRFAAELRGRGFEVVVWEAERAKERQPFPGLFRKPLQAVRLAGAIARRALLLVSRRIDLVHLNNSPGTGFHNWLLAARSVGRSCVSHVRGYFPPQQRPIWRRLVRGFDHYIAISETTRRYLEEEGFPMDRTSVVIDTIDEADLRSRLQRSREEVREELGARDDTILVVMVGHLREWKGQDVVLTALSRLPDSIRSRFRVAFAGGLGRGTEEYYRHLLDQTLALGLSEQVQFLGERTDAPDLMRASDIVLHASTIPEPFGLVVLEGMLLDRPVVASVLGGPAEVIRPGTGLLFDPRRPEELVAALERLTDPSIRKTLAIAGHARALEFGTVQQTAQRVVEIYRKVPRLRRKIAGLSGAGS